MTNRITLAFVALAALIVSAVPGFAADKGVPSIPTRVHQEQDRNFNGCFVSGAGQFMFAEVSGFGGSVKSFMGGMGCDRQVGKIVYGALAEYGLGEGDVRTAALTGRIGITLNPHTLLYGTLSLTMDGRNITLDDSLVSAGVGLETYLGTKHWTVFVEGQQSILARGGFKDLDVMTARAGVRYRF